jgi:hypothetical protein
MGKKRKINTKEEEIERVAVQGQLHKLSETLSEPGGTHPTCRPSYTESIGRRIGPGQKV